MSVPVPLTVIPLLWSKRPITRAVVGDIGVRKNRVLDRSAAADQLTVFPIHFAATASVSELLMTHTTRSFEGGTEAMRLKGTICPW